MTIDIRKELEWLRNELRNEAHEQIPLDYLRRNLGNKYLKADNEAAGLNDAADRINDLLSRTPRGFKLRPRKPSEAMMRAGDEAIKDGVRKALVDCPYGLHPSHASWNVWRAMWDACAEEQTND